MIFYIKCSEISTSACGKLYSASILSGIRFKPGILYEDNLLLSDVFECVDKGALFQNKNVMDIGIEP